MRRRTFLLLALAGVVAATGYGLGRPLVRAARLAGPVGPPPREITQAHVEALRNLRFAWNFSIEGGGPMVDPAAPYGDGAWPGARVHREVCALLVWMLAERPLAPGRYRVEGLDAAGMEARIREEFEGFPAERVAAVLGTFAVPDAEGFFAFTEDHARLLPGLAWEWPDPALVPALTRRVLFGAPVPVVDFKRPFGDATAFALDMADLLGLPRPESAEENARLNRLYDSLWVALQVYVQNVPLEVGPLLAE